MATLNDLYLIAGISTPLVLAIAFVIKKFRTRDKTIADRFSGNWTNEGDITCSPKTHHVELIALSCKGKEIGGIIVSKNLENGSSLPNGSLLGKRKGKVAIVKVVDVRRGKLVEYGSLKLSLKPHVLHLETISQNRAGFFPSELDVWMR